MIYVRNSHGKNYTMPIETYGKTQCAAYGCKATTVDRAHVMKCDVNGVISSKKVYIIPLCYAHNRSRSDEPIHVKDSTVFIPLNDE